MTDLADLTSDVRIDLRLGLLQIELHALERGCCTTNESGCRGSSEVRRVLAQHRLIAAGNGLRINARNVVPHSQTIHVPLSVHI